MRIAATTVTTAVTAVATAADVAGLTVASASTATAAPSSSAQVAQAAPKGSVLDAADKAGDVKIYRQRAGATRQVRKSIDLRTVSVRQKNGAVRFTVGVKKVLPASAASTQVAYLSVSPDASSGQTWAFDLGMTPQQPGGGYANYVADATGQGGGSSAGDRFCGALRTRTSAKKDTISVDVPRRCVPADPGVLEVTTLVGGYRNGEPALSLDTLAVPVVGALR